MNWVKVTLKEVSEEVKYGYTESASKEKIGPKFLRITDIAQERLEWEDVPYCKITSGEIEKYKLLEGDIVIARTGATTGFAKRIKSGIPEAVFASYLVRFRIKPEIDNRFVGALVESNIYKEYIKSIVGGAAQPNANAQSLGSFEFYLPDITTQQKIASILSAYDDLIENNTHRIKILEAMAQSIYKEWFVNFHFPGHEKVKFVESPLGKIPEGWEAVNLVDVANVDYGYPFNSSEFCKNPAGNPVVRIRDIKNNKTQTFTFEEVDEKYKVKNGDIIIGMDGDFFMGKWAGGEAWLNQRNARVRPKSDVSKYYLFHCLVEPINFFDSTIVGTTVAHLSKRDFDSIKIIIPRNKILKDISEILDPIYEEEIILLSKNENLRKTRDLLLPKLMSGEVEV